MKIDFIGWYSRFNVGDDAFEFVFRREFCHHDINFVTPPNNVRKDCDIVILGGGAVVSPFYLGIVPLDKPLYGLGVDIAYESEINLLSKLPFREIYVRNKKDANDMRQKLNCKIVHIPDIAFGISPTDSKIIERYKKTDKKSLGVFATDYVNPAIDRSYKKFTNRSNNFKINLAARLDILSRDYEIFLIPCSTQAYGDDRRINLDLVAYMENSPINIMDTIGPQEMVNLTCGLDLAICMRFHSHIFALISGIPFVSIEFTRKVKLLLEDTKLTNTSVGRFEGDEFLIDNTELIIQKAKQDKDYAKSGNLYLARLFKTIRSNWFQELV